MRVRFGLGQTTACVMLLLAMSTSAHAQGPKLVVNGNTVSTGVKSINGKVYVPLADVAKAFGLTVAKQPGGYALVEAGGANEIADAHRGKMGETIFTGQFRFLVTGIDKVDSYTPKNIADVVVTPTAGNSLFVVHCRIKNGTREKQELVFSTDDMFGNVDTALTDDQEHTYAPYNFEGGKVDGYDVHIDETAPNGSYVLPGAAIDFTIIFNAPSDTHPKDLIFSILKYAERDKAKTKSVDVRVSVSP